MQITENEKVIATRYHRGPYEDYEMMESLCRNQDGEYWLSRSFTGEYSNLNLVRKDFVMEHDGEKISAEDAERWLEKSRTEKKDPLSDRDIFDIGIHYGYESSEVLEYDSAWFKDFLKENSRDAEYIAVGTGYYLYNEAGHWWEQMSDVVNVDLIRVKEKTLSELCDSVTESLKNTRRIAFHEPTVYIDRLTLYDHDWKELGGIENNDFAKTYAEFANNADGYDVLGWD